MSITFFVPGIAQPRQGDRSFAYTPKDGGKPFVKHYQPANSPASTWKATVAMYAKKAMGNESPWDCPVAIDLVFLRLRPKSKNKAPWPDTKPDLDNLEKPVLDALQGILYTNDSRIVSKRVFKLYDDIPGLEIRAWKTDELPKLLEACPVKGEKK